MSYLDDLENCKGKFNPHDSACTKCTDSERRRCLLQSVLWVPPGDVVCTPDPHRTEDDEILDESILETDGPLQQIVAVYDRKKKKFEVIIGARRFQSLQRLGWEEIPLAVRDIRDEKKVIYRLHENIHRKDYSPLELAKALGELRDKHGMKQKEIAKALGKPEAWVSKVLSAAKLPESIKEKMETGKAKVGIEKAHQLSHMEPERAEKMVEAGATRKEVERASRGRRLRYQWKHKGTLASGTKFQATIIFNDEDIEPNQIIEALEVSKAGI